MSTDKLMQKYIDRQITVDQIQGDKIETFTGTLLSTAGGLVLKDANVGVQVIRTYSNVRFPELPGGLITRPTLVWDVVTKAPGEHRTRVVLGSVSDSNATVVGSICAATSAKRITLRPGPSLTRRSCLMMA